MVGPTPLRSYFRSVSLSANPSQSVRALAVQRKSVWMGAPQVLQSPMVGTSGGSFSVNIGNFLIVVPLRKSLPKHGQAGLY